MPRPVPPLRDGLRDHPPSPPPPPMLVGAICMNRLILVVWNRSTVRVRVDLGLISDVDVDRAVRGHRVAVAVDLVIDTRCRIRSPRHNRIEMLTISTASDSKIAAKEHHARSRSSRRRWLRFGSHRRLTRFANSLDFVEFQGVDCCPARTTVRVNRKCPSHRVIRGSGSEVQGSK